MLRESDADVEQAIAQGRKELIKGIEFLGQGRVNCVVEQAHFANQKVARALAASRGYFPTNSFAVKAVLEEFGLIRFFPHYDAAAEANAFRPSSSTEPIEAKRILSQAVLFFNAALARFEGVEPLSMPGEVSEPHNRSGFSEQIRGRILR